MTIGSYAFYLVRGLPPLPKLWRPVRIGFLDSSIPPCSGIDPSGYFRICFFNFACIPLNTLQIYGRHTPEVKPLFQQVGISMRRLFSKNSHHILIIKFYTIDYQLFKIKIVYQHFDCLSSKIFITLDF